MNSQIDVQIQGKTFRIACQSEEEESLASAVKKVDEEISRVAKVLKNPTSDRLVVMAAINIAHSFLQLESEYTELKNKTLLNSESQNYEDFTQQINSMTAKLNNLLK